MSAIETTEPLSPEASMHLADFARACRGAARVVALYPPTHPAIEAALRRVAGSAERLRSQATVAITVLPDGLLLDGRTADRSDAALADLAGLLHSHLVGELTFLGELSLTSWHAFLTLVARPPEDIRRDGGIGRAWLAAGGGPIEIRQIDYTEVLRDRDEGLAVEWNRLIANYLEGELSDIDDRAMSALFEIANDQHRFREFTELLVTQATQSGRRGKKEVVLRVLQALADYVARTAPDQLDRILHRIAGVLPQLTPELVISLITTGAPVAEGEERGIDLPGEVRARISDDLIAEFVAQSVSRDHGATERLAQAFQTLVPSFDQRRQLIDMAREELETMPIRRHSEFPALWKSAETLLSTYSDASFVGEDYARELSTSRAHAVDVERISDDPPERIHKWLASVSDDQVQRLDQRLLIDLLRIETREVAWKSVLQTTLAYLDQLVLGGSIPLAQQLLDAVTAAAADGQPFAAAARTGLDELRGGALVNHLLLVIRQARDQEMDAVGTFCLSLGPTVIGPLANALAIEQGFATVKRLREILLGFGSAGRQYADELRTSANPAVRRVAIDLLRAYGGADALPDLTALLDDNEPAVQRDALRAIVQIGTDEAYQALESALKSGTSRTRTAMMRVLGSSRDERAAPLFVYMLEHTDYRALEGVYLSAIEALGKVGGDAESLAALRKVLYRREWWAPLRTRRMRRAAALALRASGSDVARQTLEEAASEGRRGVRRAARTALQESPAASRSTG